MKKNNFDRIAFLYDRLAKLIFSSSIKNAQLVHLDVIPDKGKVLIIGGGTGWILNEIFKKKLDVHITYIELSQKMLHSSKRSVSKSKVSQVHFIHGDEESLKLLKSQFDVIITNFFLDVFQEKRLLKVMYDLKLLLNQDGFWINTDFVKHYDSGYNFWKRGLIKIMYIFFRILCNVEGSRLLNFKEYFSTLELNHMDNQRFFYDMIHADLYKLK